MARWNSANRSRYYHLLNKLADLGHNIIIVQPPPLVSEETNYIDLPGERHPNIELLTAEMPSWLWNARFPVEKFFKKAAYTLNSYFLVRRLIKERKPDFLLIYNLPQYVYTFADGIPIVFDYADDYIAMLEHELGISSSNVLSRLCSRILERIIVKSSLVTSVSEILHKRVHHRNKMLLPNGTDDYSRSADRTILHIDKTKPVIGYVGAFEYFIDLDLILDAAERLSQYTFLLVGAGREFGRVKDCIARRKIHNVNLTGPVPHRQAMQFISEMDICLNLFQKGAVADAASPIKLFEYISNGKPVITSRLRETQRLGEEMDSFLYAENVSELIDAIETVLRNQGEYRKKARKAAKVIQSRYTWSSLAGEFTRQLEKTMLGAQTEGSQASNAKFQSTDWQTRKANRSPSEKGR